MDVLKNFLKKIEDLMSELQLAVNNAKAISDQNNARQTELSDLITENKNRSLALDKKAESLSTREKDIEQGEQLKAQLKELDAAQKEHRRIVAVFDEQKRTHEKKSKDELAEIERKKTKLATEREAFEAEKADWKERESKKIIDDFVKQKLRS